MAFQRKHSVILGLSILYFSIIILYSICTFLDILPLKEFLGFIRIPVLAFLYFYVSVKKDYLYFLALLFFQAAYLFFGRNTETSLFLGAAASVVFRLFIVAIIFNVVTDKRWGMIFLTSLPILFVYIYLINLIKETVLDSYYLWMTNGSLTAFLGGLAVTNYCYKDDKKSFWLLISAMLFVIQIGLFFVNKFYLKQQVFLQLIILFYGISHYTFYKFMIFKDMDESEQAKQPV
jgi:hypothetical protein